MRPHPLLISALGVIAAVALGATVALLTPPIGSAPFGTGTAPVEVPIGGPFTLVSEKGEVTEKDLLGRYALIFFGFTNCPDICPATLEHMARTLVALGDRAKDVTAVFISVDPERDTIEIVGDYVAYFDKRILGLTGSVEQVTRAARAFKAYFAKTELEGGGYTIDHTSIVYLMGPDGKFRAVLRSDEPPDAVAARIIEVMRFDATG